MANSVETLLLPGKSSERGFLGRGESFEDVVRSDSQILEELGLQHRDISVRLQYLAEAVYGIQRCYGGCKEVVIDKKYVVKPSHQLGYQFCPWDDGEEVNHDFFVENSSNGRKIMFSELHPHLISEHHFFEGKGTMYRLDPLEAISVLDIKTPKASTSDVENRLYKALTGNLESQYREARKHALQTLPWFKERADLPVYISTFIKHLRDHAKFNCDEYNWDFSNYVTLLINLGLTLPEGAGRFVNPQIYGLLDILNKENDICGYVRRDLLKFKRDVEGTTHPNVIDGFYWQDYIELRLAHTPAELVQAVVDYVQKRNVTVDDVVERGVEHWGAFLQVDALTGVIKRDENLRESFKDKVQNNIFSPYAREGEFFLDKMRKKLPYLNSDDESPEALRQRLHFFEVATDIAALQITPIKFDHYLAEKRETLTLLGLGNDAAKKS